MAESNVFVRVLIELIRLDELIPILESGQVPKKNEE